MENHNQFLWESGLQDPRIPTGSAPLVSTFLILVMFLRFITFICYLFGQSSIY